MINTSSQSAAPRATGSSLRILQLSDLLFEEEPGGSRQVVRELLREQNRMGHRTTLLVASQNTNTVRRWQDPALGEIVQYFKGNNPAEWIKNGRDAAALLVAEAEKEGRPFDVAHTHFAYASVGPLGALTEKTMHVRTFHGPWDEEGWVEDSRQARSAPVWKKPLLFAKAVLKQKYRNSVETKNLQASKSAIVLSEQWHQSIRGYGYREQNIVKIPGGVDRERFYVDTANPEARAQARAKVDLPADAFPLLLSIRRLVPRMGLENLIEALPRIRQEFPKAQVVIGGTGPLAESLKEQAKTLGVAEYVTFPGFIPDEQVVDYYRGADVFILPTLALEGFGLVIVEALASGTPVIATPVGAIPEVLGELDKRLLTAGTTAQHLGDSILEWSRAKNTPGSWVAGLTAARLCAYVDDRYTWKKHAQAVDAVYRQALGTNN